MNEKELNFDRKKHICYSNKVREAIQNRLRSQYCKNETDKL